MPKLRPVPWLLAFQMALAAKDRWDGLTPKERARLQRLLRDSKGRPSNLTAKHREELKYLVGKLDIVGLGRELVPLARSRGRKRP